MRILLLSVLEVVAMLGAALMAFFLRFEFSIPKMYVPVLGLALPVWIIIKTGVFLLLQVHQRSLRYTSLMDIARLGLANVLGSTISFLVLMAVLPWVPRSICALDLLLCFLCTAGWRMVARLLTEVVRPAAAGHTVQRAVIYGAGQAGVALLRELQHNSTLPYEVCGFIDDARSKTGLSIYGCRVLGPGSALPGLAQRHQIAVALIAIPSASGVAMNRILQYCHAAKITFKTIPGLAEMITGDGLARQMRDVNLEDLLGRSPVYLEQGRIESKLQGQTVLVTGAAGSIGSELCRQIARFGPAALVGYDIAETGLFHVEQEMRQAFSHVPFFPEVGSIQNRKRLADVFAHYKPAVVYHAAAYKHVPLMESHAFEAVANNVFGTLNVAQAAEAYGVADFVMISSDKAVRPTNIMGTTKRVAELVVRALSSARLKYVSVRFGNVLGSNGSVVPSFKKQIAAGGPVTVTHPDMRRYFMTIPEACQLVLQASSMGAGGEIFVLDMGEPVRIVDLARNLILLSGLRPEQDIPIKFTGIRPGEKLFEELNTLDEDTRPTYHEKIKVFAGPAPVWTNLRGQLSRLERAMIDRQLVELLEVLQELVPEYTPSADLLNCLSSESVIPLAATGTHDRWS